MEEPFSLLYNVIVPVILVLVTILAEMSIDQWVFSRFLEPYVNFLSLHRQILLLNLGTFLCFLSISLINCYMLYVVFTYVSEVVGFVPPFVQIHLVLGNTLALIPRWVSVTYSRRRGRTIGLAVVFPFSFLFSLSIFYPNAYPYLFPMKPFTDFAIFLIPTALCYCLSEFALSTWSRHIIVKRKITDIVEQCPSSHHHIIGRSALYDKISEMVSRCKKEAIGISGTFAFRDKPEYSVEFKRALQKFRESLSEASNAKVRIRYMGPITKSNLDNVIDRWKAGVEVRHLEFEEPFMRVLVNDSNQLLLSTPLVELPEESHASSFYSNEPFISSIIHLSLSAMWEKSQPFRDRLKALNRMGVITNQRFLDIMHARENTVTRAH